MQQLVRTHKENTIHQSTAAALGSQIRVLLLAVAHPHHELDSDDLLSSLEAIHDLHQQLHRDIIGIPA